jgi:hypothetical protein
MCFLAAVRLLEEIDFSFPSIDSLHCLFLLTNVGWTQINKWNETGHEMTHT